MFASSITDEMSLNKNLEPCIASFSAMHIGMLNVFFENFDGGYRELMKIHMAGF